MTDNLQSKSVRKYHPSNTQQELGSSSLRAWLFIPVLLLTSHVALGILFDLSEPCTNCIYLMGTE